MPASRQAASFDFDSVVGFLASLKHLLFCRSPSASAEPPHGRLAHPPFDAQIATLDVLVDRLFRVGLVYGEDVISEHSWFLCRMLHLLPLTNAFPAQRADIFILDVVTTIQPLPRSSARHSSSAYPCIPRVYVLSIHFCFITDCVLVGSILTDVYAVQCLNETPSRERMKVLGCRRV